MLSYEQRHHGRTPAEDGERAAKIDAADDRLEKAAMAYRIAVADYVEGLITKAECTKAEQTYQRARRAWTRATN